MLLFPAEFAAGEPQGGKKAHYPAMRDVPPRRPLLAVIGQGGTISAPVRALAEEAGSRACEAGFRIACGGLGGVMEAVCRGARQSPAHVDGTTLGFLPGTDPCEANPWVDVPIATGLGLARNLVLVTSADVVLAIAGGSGTLHELAAAWQLARPIVALTPSGGWAGRLAGQPIDDRIDRIVESAKSPREAVECALRIVDGEIPPR